MIARIIGGQRAFSTDGQVVDNGNVTERGLTDKQVWEIHGVLFVCGSADGLDAVGAASNL
jgi:hypothetical protein